MSGESVISDILYNYMEVPATRHRIRAKSVSPPGKVTGVSVQLSLALHDRTTSVMEG